VKSELTGIHECQVIVQRPTVGLADAFEALEFAAIEILLVELAWSPLVRVAFLAYASEWRIRPGALAVDVEEGALQSQFPHWDCR